jgi:fatty acid desaturase
MLAPQSKSAAIHAYLSKDELARMYAINSWAVARATVFTWFCILGSFWAWSVTHHWLVWAAAFFVIATRQHALNNLVHEAAHYSISRDRALNDWISDVLYAAPHLISTEGYRQKHLLHHSDLGDPRLDTEIKPRYLIAGTKFFKQTALALFGYAAIVAVRSYTPMLQGPKSAPNPRHALLVAATNGGLLAYCWWLGAPLAYFHLWLLPLFTLTMYISTLRVIAEHQPEAYAAAGIENLDGQMPKFTRSIAAGALERFVFGPVNFCYHNDHHFVPGVPFAHLPELNRLLRDRGFYEADDEHLARNYLGVLYRLVFPSRAAARTGVDAQGGAA